jgi:hypothetical protein
VGSGGTSRGMSGTRASTDVLQRPRPGMRYAQGQVGEYTYGVTHPYPAASRCWGVPLLREDIVEGERGEGGGNGEQRASHAHVKAPSLLFVPVVRSMFAL